MISMLSSMKCHPNYTTLDKYILYLKIGKGCVFSIKIIDAHRQNLRRISHSINIIIKIANKYKVRIQNVI